MSRRALLVAVLVGVMVMALSTAALAGAVIRTDGQRWSPARLRVDRGTRVVWRATGGTHDVNAYGGNWSFSSHDISPSGDPTVARTFRRTGTFRFFCNFHANIVGGVCSGMCGRVRVTA
jgi:plastocyanin